MRTRRVRRERNPAEPAGEPPPVTDRVPRVARMLAIAHHWRRLIRDGVVKDQAALSHLVGMSQARVTQVMDLLYLAPDIQESVLDPLQRNAAAFHERGLRVLAAEPLWLRQRAAWT